MCLDTIMRRTKTKATFTAYQVFRLPFNHHPNQPSLNPLYRAHSEPPKIGVWQRAKNCDYGRSNAWIGSFSPANGGRYPAGFHCWTNILDAEVQLKRSQMNGVRHAVIRKVRIRGVQTIGLQDGHEVWVAKERMILPKRKGA